MEYTVKRGFMGKRRVHFACPQCGSGLESPIEDAGNRYPCPMCQREMTIPGIEELQKLRTDTKAREDAKLREASRKAVYAKAHSEHEAAEAQRRASQRIERSNTNSGGGKLFLIITGAVACGIVIVSLAYFFLYTAVISAHLPAAMKNAAMGVEEELFLEGVRSRNVESVRRHLLGNLNWQQVATPAFNSLMIYRELDTIYSEYDSDERRTERTFWLRLGDRLLENGADPSAALANVDDLKTIKFLVAHGANVNAVDVLRDPILIRIARDRRDDEVAFLISKGANVNATGHEGQTALHEAATNNAVKVINRLLSAGAKINAKNKNGQTPLAVAKLAMQKDAEVLLQSKGGSE